MPASDDALTAAALAALETGPMPQGVGLAVSGGGDSMAMLHMLGPALRARGIPVAVATVDHGLRPEAAAEAALVARAAGGLGLVHQTLRWTGWDGQGNLPAAARAARFRLLGDWARGQGFGHVVLAHTRDDQAETLLMRLARGSGVDGLSAMRPARRRDGIVWTRPFLDVSRAALRDWLTLRGHSWIEDPSNADLTRERVRIRQALPALAALGLTPEALAATADRMGRARDVLDAAMQEAARMAEVRAGALILPRGDLLALPAEIGTRLIGRALNWINPAGEAARHAALRLALAGLAGGQARSLGGGVLIPWRHGVVIARETRPVAGLSCATSAIWDHRWRLDGPHGPDLTIRALGEVGLAQCPDWRDIGLPRAALLTTPAVWRGETLIAAPAAGLSAGWTARIAAGFDAFLKSD